VRFFSFLKDAWAKGVGGSSFYFYFFPWGGVLVVNRWRWERFCFFFRSGWVQAFNYLFLVVGGVGDT